MSTHFISCPESIRSVKRVVGYKYYSSFFYKNNWRSSKLHFSGFYIIRRLKKRQSQKESSTSLQSEFEVLAAVFLTVPVCSLVTLSLGEFFPMFQGVELLTMKTKALTSFETSVTTCPVLCHTPEDWNPRTCSGWMKPQMTSSSWYA